ncbi:YbaY family lipoprotein [Ferrimonas marina]|uniref:Putative lipoprotein n=1 Tax=Ferrimonas marina TaxID=299255 RepID=A0A1M5ZAS6_9GAMM|nr:YbaY family lipoprotein [Ferrimonas marina]SHI21325.1 putative lipoprotein [Ferrimonas marina]
MIRFGMALLLAALLAGCGGPQVQVYQAKNTSDEFVDSSTLDGEVFYRERILLAPGTVMKVILADVSKQDVPAQVLASQAFEVQGAPPFPFELSFDHDLIESGRTYAVSVRIEEKGELRFITTSHKSPFNDEYLEIFVEAVAEVTP